MDIDEDLETCKDFAFRELRRFGQVVRLHCNSLEELIGRRAVSNSCQVSNFVQKPQDGVCPALLVKTGSPVFDKIILSMSSVCVELDTLSEEDGFVKEIHDYGESTGAPELQLSRFIPTLRKLTAYVSRCTNSIQLAVSQVIGLFSFAPQNDSVTAQVIFLSLGKLFISLAALDIVIRQQTVLKDHIQLYMRLLKSRQYEAKLTDQVKALLKLLTDINIELLEGTILRDCIRKVQNSSPKFFDALRDTIRSHLADLEGKINESQAQIFLRSKKFVGLCCLFLLHFTLKQQADRQLLRTIVEISKKIGAVYLSGNAIWDAQNFFMREIPALSTLLPSQNKSFLHMDQILSRLSQDVTGYENQTTLWLLRMDASFNNLENDQIVEKLKIKCKLLLHGDNLSRCLNQQICLVVNLHVSAGKAMSRSTVVSVARMICALTGVKRGLSSYQSRVDEAIAHIDQYLHQQLSQTVIKMKQRMAVEKKTEKKKLDANAAIKLAEASLRGPFTKFKEICINVAKEFIVQIKIIRPDEANQFNSNLKRLSTIANYGKLMKEDTNLWNLRNHHVVLLEAFLSQMYKNNSLITNGATSPMIETLANGDQFIGSVEKIINDTLIQQLCKDVENDLRIQMHTHLVADDRNPFVQTKPQSQTQLKRICQSEFSLPTEKLSVKRGVERYLERIFYNLTTVALHDWGTYDEMRVVAELKFSAQTVESYLPAETLDQGLDVLTVMRNIEGFSSKYVYNMNNQTFVERVSAHKHLNTVNIGHIANSIRTHGPGITNTTVNVIYRFLRNQFKVFSQLLFDEHIRSRLIRDISFFRDNKELLQQKYPFVRAEKVSKSIRSLGVSPEGFTYLDKFRQLMTCLGNAMGYIRMMRTGVLEYCAHGNAILPDTAYKNYEGFLKGMKNTSFQNHFEVSEAAQYLDSVISRLLKQQSGVESTDYYKHLVDAFEGPFSDEKTSYLRNFYILIPSLTLNFVEHIVQGRERLTRNNKNDAIFTDDGFAVGIAFALRLTKQFASFDSLHWFQSVDEKHAEELQRSREASRNSLLDEKLAQTISLTTKRIEAYRKEFNLLNHAFTSARIFFKTT